MTQAELGDLIHKTVAAGGTPVLVCYCGLCTWMFEGTVAEAYKKYVGECPKCKQEKMKTVLADLKEDQL